MTAIVAGDLKFYLTTTVGASGFSQAQANKDASLGKYCSTTQWAGGSLEDLFDLISGDENAAGAVDYRCIVIANDTAGGNPFIAPKAFISAQTAGGADIAIGLDPLGVKAKTAQVAANIATETTAPVGVAFSSPTDKASGLAVADIPPGSCFALWIRRTATNSAAINPDGATLTVSGDTDA